MEPVSFDSTTIGRVVIEDSSEAGGSVLLKIENLKSSKFRIQKSDKSLAVMLAR
jgi:hypothetical protein